MDPIKAYAQARERLITRAAGLDQTAQHTPVPATPLWTVRDIYSHVAGCVDDLLAGRTEGLGGAEWTRAQVDSRRDVPLADVCAGWQRQATAFTDFLAVHGGEIGPNFAAADVWHHEQDVRGALGEPVDRDSELGRYLAERTVMLMIPFLAPGHSALRLEAVDLPGSGWQVGKGQPAATLRATGFELARAIMGRRTAGQILAMDWDGDGTSFLEALHSWELPTVPLNE